MVKQLSTFYINDVQLKDMNRQKLRKNKSKEVLSLPSEAQRPDLIVQDKDLNVARKIQIAMVPHSVPAIDGLDIDSLFIPCGAVGGDLYDIIPISKDILAFLIYDVTGYGVTSTLISAMAKVCFAKHIRTIQSPRAVLERVNMEIIRDIPAEFYFTAFLGYLDLHDNKLTYGNAGHAYPLVYRKKDSAFISLKTQGTFIGVFENGFFEEQSIYLSPGDCLLLFTDGIYPLYSGNANIARKQFEEEALSILNSGSHKNVLGQVKSKYNDYIDNKPIEDDITAVVVEVLTQSRKNQIKEKLGFDAGDPVYLQYISYYEEMDSAIGIILSTLDTYGYPDETIRKMKITLTELLVNAILHGNNRDFSKKVTIGHVITKSKAVISIMDEGEGFNPDGLPDPTLPENLTRDCGRGLFIVRHYVDEVGFNDTGNRITITKTFTMN
jgi:serine phosphatase RsbU (regulator of sigma subunit)/anti-sigma regulatory factor (Ser/Thr protein kinase)